MIMEQGDLYCTYYTWERYGWSSEIFCQVMLETTAVLVLKVSQLYVTCLRGDVLWKITHAEFKRLCDPMREVGI
jgi:hypothetical protein